MAWTKWLAGIVGYISAGPLGALAGYALGALVDNLMSGNTTIPPEDNPAPPRQQAQRNDFLFSLLVLMAYVIQADGRIMHSEMQCARQFLRKTFGPQAEQEGDQVLKRLFQLSRTKTTAQWEQQIQDCCTQLTYELPETQRLQLLALLIDLAKADQHVAPEEIAALRRLAQWMAISQQMVDQLAHLGEDTLEAAYQLLGLTPDATDEQVRQAYRKMALQCHPDRVQALGEDIRRQAEENFKRLGQAKQLIYNARGMK